MIGSLIGLLGLALFLIPLGLAVEPYGSQVSHINSSRSVADSAESNVALAGNVTEMDLFSYSITQTWQGFFGNVTGTIQLADASDNVFYNWSAARPLGEVYASMNSSITWTNIQCFNFTSNGTFDNDVSYAGGTSQSGINLSMLEAQFTINETDYDGINETFGYADGAFPAGIDHAQFYTASRQFDAGECVATSTFDNTGKSVASDFQEVILYEPATTSVIWATIIERDEMGFDSRPHDFQLMVPEDGHGTNIVTTTYYFFVELD